MVNKKAFVTLLVLVGLVLIISRSPVEFEEVMPALQTSTLNPSNLTAQSVLLASTVRDLDFYRQLPVGSRLILQLDANNIDAIAEVVFTKVAMESGITSIKGTVANDNGSMLMTIGDKFIHIFLALDKGIYEFSGKDFQGFVERTRDMRFENDTVVLPPQAVELKTQPVRRPAVPESET
jgi:hypothetical protein